MNRRFWRWPQAAVVMLSAHERAANTSQALKRGVAEPPPSDLHSAEHAQPPETAEGLRRQ